MSAIDWDTLVAAARNNLLDEGKPVFVVVHHYGMTGLLSFYMPEGRIAPDKPPLVYSILGGVPENQFYFWPEYRYQNYRQGNNAIFVVESERPRYSWKAWFKSLVTGAPEPPPQLSAAAAPIAAPVARPTAPAPTG